MAEISGLAVCLKARFGRNCKGGPLWPPVVRNSAFTKRAATEGRPYSVPSRPGFASKVTWTQSVQGAVATWSNEGVNNVRKYRRLITDQVATAPCTDRVQEWFRTFEAKLAAYSHTRCNCFASSNNLS